MATFLAHATVHIVKQEELSEFFKHFNGFVILYVSSLVHNCILSKRTGGCSPRREEMLKLSFTSSSDRLHFPHLRPGANKARKTLRAI